MLLINKHSQVSSSKLRGLLNFAVYDVGYKTEHICITVVEQADWADAAVTVKTEYFSDTREEVCCTELFPDYEEVVGDRYGCGLSLNITVCINEEKDVDLGVEIEHIRLQGIAESPIPVKSWEALFVYEMAKIMALLKEGVIGQFIHKRHWWYRTQKHSLERLLAWNAEKHTYGDDTDLFENVFRLKDAARVAERLHEKFCGSPDCDWDYYDWNSKQIGFERTRYKEIAGKLLKKGFNIDEAILVIGIWEWKDE